MKKGPTIPAPVKFKRVMKARKKARRRKNFPRKRQMGPSWYLPKEKFVPAPQVFELSLWGKIKRWLRSLWPRA